MCRNRCYDTAARPNQANLKGMVAPSLMELTPIDKPGGDVKKEKEKAHHIWPANIR